MYRLLKLQFPLHNINNDVGDSGGSSSVNTADPATEEPSSKAEEKTACGTNQATIGEGQATGPGSTQVNANHIIQYPRQPKMDDGKWIAVASLIGSILGKFADNGTVSKAKSAESEWQKINESLADKGWAMWDRMLSELAEADKADNDLENHYSWNVAQRDSELARAEKLDDCNDELHEKICAFANCGYTPDYDGIKSRIMADVAGQVSKSRREMMRSLNRYSVKACCGIETALATTAVSTAVSALYRAREDERSRAFQINEGLLFKAGAHMEQARANRFNSATSVDARSVAIQQTRYDAHNRNYMDLARTGADFLSSAGKNYAWLADSYRKTAEKMSQDLAQLGALIAVVTGIFLGQSSGENGCEC